MSDKLDFEQRQEANWLVESVADDPEAAAFELVALRSRSASDAALIERLKAIVAERTALDVHKMAPRTTARLFRCGWCGSESTTESTMQHTTGYGCQRARALLAEAEGRKGC